MGKKMIKQPRVRLRLGEVRVVAAGPADQSAAGAPTTGRQQVPVGTPVDERRPRQAADQPVGAVAAVEAVGAWTGLDQIVLGAAVDQRRSLSPAAEADAADSAKEPSITASRSLPAPRPTVNHRAGPLVGQEHALASPGGCTHPTPAASTLAPPFTSNVPASARPTAEAVVPTAADHLEAGAAGRRGVELDPRRSLQ